MQYSRFSDEEHIVCLLCKHYCVLKKDGHGICGVNYNIDSSLVNKTYGHPSALHADPIEKKPLYHFLPNSRSLSLGTVGCNFRCPFCQNYSISQTSLVDESITLMPHEIVDLALKHNCQSISYTYNEPTIWYPYAKDIGILAKEKGIKNVFVSSGYESHEVLEDMRSWVDAANIDLKSFSHEYYQKVLKTDLGGVGSAAVQLAHRRGARVLALAGADKERGLRAIGAQTVLPRETPLPTTLGTNAVDVVIDVVGGAGFGPLLEALKPGGRYATAGAIAGPVVSLDLRTLYLKDQTLFGCTTLSDHVFAQLIRYIEQGEIRPLVAATLPLRQIVEAQQLFLRKAHLGKIVLQVAHGA